MILHKISAQETLACAVNGYNKRLDMTPSNRKSQELDARNIMEGLEEFATFASFNSNLSGMRVLSVETAQLPLRPHSRLKTVETCRPEHKAIAL